ncbi:MAG: hypothetical protein Q9204_008776, partial [Flavoplaca sp. TL-2023a]
NDANAGNDAADGSNADAGADTNQNNVDSAANAAAGVNNGTGANPDQEDQQGGQRESRSFCDLPIDQGLVISVRASEVDDLLIHVFIGLMATAQFPGAPLSQAKSTSPLRATNLSIQHVALGDILFKTWYPSYYPEGLVGRGLDRLYKLCHARCDSPPGQLIYSKDDCAIYEVDGEEHQLFSQNLSLFAKLFLDNKSVFFDVASFNFYLLAHKTTNGQVPEAPPQIIGFFSKEKMSWDNNNLACILVFPPWQRKGLGKVLMGISYELSRFEGRIGGPEKPLSELGRIGYLKFWQARVANALLDLRNKSTLSVEEIADACWMLPEDVITTLKEMDVLETKKIKKQNSFIINKTRVRAWLTESKINLAAPVDEAGFAEDFLIEDGD